MGWHARLRHADLKSLRVFRVTDFERIRLLYLPLLDGVEILRVVHGSRNLQALQAPEIRVIPQISTSRLQTQEQQALRLH